MKIKLTIIALALLPSFVSAQFLGYSQPNGLGGWNYYSAPNAGYDNAAATSNFLNAMRMIQQQRQFNRQMDMLQRDLDREDRRLEWERRANMQ